MGHCYSLVQPYPDERWEPKDKTNPTKVVDKRESLPSKLTKENLFKHEHEHQRRPFGALSLVVTDSDTDSYHDSDEYETASSSVFETGSELSNLSRTSSMEGNPQGEEIFDIMELQREFKVRKLKRQLIQQKKIKAQQTANRMKELLANLEDANVTTDLRMRPKTKPNKLPGLTRAKKIVQL
jgi:formate dehydrogenase maturation protein FdhE